MTRRQKNIRFKVSTSSGKTFMLKWVKKKESKHYGSLLCSKPYLFFPSWELLCQCESLFDVQTCVNRHFGYTSVCKRI